jgi:hypothetical protein
MNAMPSLWRQVCNLPIPLRQSVLVLAFAGLLTGCSAPLEEYVSEEGRFRISLPAQPAEEKGADLPAGLKKVSLAQQSGSYARAVPTNGSTRRATERSSRSRRSR